MKNHVNSQRGFSLIELMVVVGIIGILAAIAVPQFSKFQAKSRQSEAKSLLSALYTSEKAFNSEYSGYASNLVVIGATPSGDIGYNYGFGGAVCGAAWACAPSYLNSHAGDATFAANPSPRGYCANAGAAMANGCRIKSDGTAAAPNSVIGALLDADLTQAVAPTPATFVASAAGVVLSGSGTADQWTINQDKLITQFSNGIP